MEKQVIIHGGSKTSPQKVENILNKNDVKYKIAVLRISNTPYSQNIRAYVAPKPGVKALPAAETLKKASDRIGKKAPEEIFAIKKLPENAAGEIGRVALAKPALADISPSRGA